MNVEKILSEMILVGLGAILSTGAWMTAYCVKKSMEEKRELEREEKPKYDYSAEIFRAEATPGTTVIKKEE